MERVGLGAKAGGKNLRGDKKLKHRCSKEQQQQIKTKKLKHSTQKVLQTRG